jgi:hypothetical protein
LFCRIQEKYVIPSVNEYWNDMQEQLCQDLKSPIILAGDGRNDSPGHCAQYCTYSFLDINTNRVVGLQVVDCRETNGISVNMEKVGFRKALEQVTSKASFPVSEIVTDAHVQIRALMSMFSM